MWKWTKLEQQSLPLVDIFIITVDISNHKLYTKQKYDTQKIIEYVPVLKPSDISSTTFLNILLAEKVEIREYI